MAIATKVPVMKLREEVDSVLQAARKRIGELEGCDNRAVREAVGVVRNFVTLAMWYCNIGSEELLSDYPGGVEHVNSMENMGRDALRDLKAALII